MILKLKYGFDEKELSLLENSVEPISLCRVYVKYDVLKNPWIKKLKYSSVNNPLKQIIPLKLTLVYLATPQPIHL